MQLKCFAMKGYKRGLSLTEILVTMCTTMLLFGAVFSSWIFMSKNWGAQSMNSRVRSNTETAIEHIKSEIRLSSGTYLSGYPVGASEYTAISFPLAIPDANGFYTISSGSIYWDTSVIYHTYTNPDTGNSELRRTVFTGNHDVIMDADDRAEQLTSVAETGDGAAATNGENSSTTTIIPRTPTEKLKQSVNFSMTPGYQAFNCYSENEERANVSFGYIELSSGTHTLKFTVQGKDDASEGYKFGIDTLSITPSGANREAEDLVGNNTLLDTISASSGQTNSKNGPDSMWSGNQYAEFQASSVGNYITYTLYYDLWRDSNFQDASLNNVSVLGDDMSAKLTPLAEGKKDAWFASVQASSSSGASVKSDYTGAISMRNKTFRVLLSQSNLVFAGDMIRIKFSSDSTKPLTITKAYIDIKDDSSENTPDLKFDPAELSELLQYQNSHAQIFFRDVDTGVISESVTIDPENPQDASDPHVFYSDWIIYPFDTANSYFVTFHIVDDLTHKDVSFWPGVEGTNSYYIDGESWTTVVDWSGYTESTDVLVVEKVEVWQKAGSGISSIFDTKIESPVYKTLRWTENQPVHTDILFKARSSDAADMDGAAEWDTIGASGANPQNLGIGSGRYVQYSFAMSVDVTWTCPEHTNLAITDADYKTTGVVHCTEAGCPNYLLPSVSIAEGDYCPWVDNVTINWDGEDAICELSGYMRQAPDYGVVSLTVDGNQLIKSLKFKIDISDSFQGRVYEKAQEQDVVLMNTGK